MSAFGRASTRTVASVPVPGPVALGRGVVVHDGGATPPPWRGAPGVRVDRDAVADPAHVVGRLHRAWSNREPVVIALAVDPASFRAPQAWDDAPWQLGPWFEPWLDRLHFLVWANTYDARDGEPIWWWARKAERLGARATPDGPGDIVLADGRPAWVDGGPRAPFDPLDGAGVLHHDAVDVGRLAPSPSPTAPTATLAPDQLAAVAHGAGPARVIAPAGSGKTRVLTERLRHLALDRGVETETLLAVAYNKRAQQEMEERTVDFRPRVQTLNALGYSLLTEARGRPPRVLDEREVRRLVEELVPARPRRANTDPVGPYLEALSLVRLGLRDPAEVEAERDDVPGLAAAFDPFRAGLAEAGAIDFDEQIYAAVELLLRDGERRRQAQARCRHLLVDELQDLTPAHVLMIRLLAAPGLDVFGVGDDDQVIYGHAGADPAFLLDFERLFPGAVDHPLEVNYRCPVAVVDAARHLLSYNRRRVEKVIRAGPGADPSADALRVHVHSAEAGAAALADTVQAWLSQPGTGPAQVAVLARVGSLLLAPHVALAEAGVPVDSILRPDVLERTGVRAALAYLRIGASPGGFAGADVVEVYRRPSRGFPQWFPKWLRGQLDLDRFRAIADRLDDAKVAAKVLQLADDLLLVADVVRTGTTREALTVVKDQIGLGGAMSLLDSSSAGEGGSSHLDDLEALEQVAGLHDDPRTFEPWLRTVFHREAIPGGVTLSTVHRVKGQEWDRIAVFGVTGGIVPHRLAVDVEEERRVLHVAITRARRQAVVLADAGRPSPFLAELDGTAPRERTITGASRPGVTAVPAARRPPPALPGDAEAPAAALRAWRLERSRRDKVPAYVVLSDRHLQGIAAARPSTLFELRALPGIGPTKLEAYGEEILAVLEPFVATA
jgi:DNA helicase-2/ATP-dependent DNA helicase PcrA